MQTAILFGIYSTSALIIGAVIGLYLKISTKLLGYIMAFGAGVLISALTFDLMEKAYAKGGFDSVTIGFLAGAIFFVTGDYFIDKYGGQHRKYGHVDHSESDSMASGSAIALGAFLDGIPESIAIGVSLVISREIGLVLVLAVFLSNFPEVFSSVESMMNAHISKVKIFSIWLSIAVLSIFAVIFGYKFFVGASPDTIAVILGIAAGGMLAMITDTMLPTAYKNGGNFIALTATLGFLTAFILSHLIK